MAAKKRSLHSLILIALLFTSFISVLALGGFLITLEIRTLQTQNDKLAQSAHDESYKRTQSRVEQLTALINERRRSERILLEKTLKRRIREATAQATELLTHQTNLPVSVQEELIVRTLRPVRFNDGRSYITIMDISGNVLLSPEYPQAEGQHYSRHLNEMDGMPFLSTVSRASSAREGFVEHPPFQAEGTEQFLWFYRLLPELGWIIMSNESITGNTVITQQKLLNDIQTFIRLENLNLQIISNGTNVLLSKGDINDKSTDPIVRNVVGWDWQVVATPAVEFLEQKILSEQGKLKERIYYRIAVLSIAVIVMMAITAIISMVIAKRVRGQLNHFLGDIRTFALENKPIDTEQLDIKEFYKIAKAANRFSEQRASMLRELQRLSQRDPLTDLYNRRHMSEILIVEEGRIKRNLGSFGLIIADIDHFKRINDTYGHEAGDKVIRSVATTLRDTLRRHDQISRWGGEEFLVLIPDASPIAALKVAEKLCKAIRQLEVHHKGDTIKPTLTCGATYHDGRLELAESIDRADQALYEGKRGGRDCVVPKAPMDLAIA